MNQSINIHRSKRQRRAGFTLLEVLMATALFGIMMVGLTQALDMIVHEVSGLLVDPDEGARGLAAQADRVLTDARLKATVLAGGRSFAQRCDYTSVAARLVEVYEQAAGLFAPRATSRRTP